MAASGIEEVHHKICGVYAVNAGDHPRIVFAISVWGECLGDVDALVASVEDRGNFKAITIAGAIDGKKIHLWSEQKGQRTKVAESDTFGGGANGMIRLRVACIDGNRFRFAVQGTGGKWTELAGETDGSFLPPWDRGVRTGVYVAGAAGAKASFDYFSATPGDEKFFAP